MPQLAPMPWLTLLFLMFLFKSFIFTSLWSHRPPQFTPSAQVMPSSITHHTWPWTS